MRRLLSLLVLLLLPPPSAAQELTVATFNAEFLTRPRVHVKFGHAYTLSSADRATWDQPGYRDARFAEATGAVAAVLAPLGADLLALTEVGDSLDVRQLVDSLAARGQVYPHVALGPPAPQDQTRQHVALLSKWPLTDVLPDLPGREHYLAEPDDPETETDTGISKGMRATVRAHGRDFHVYVLHLISEAGGYENDQQRVAQASIARRHMLPLLQAGALVLVAGDFNDGRGSPTLHRLRGLDDLHEDLLQTGLVRYFDDDALDTRWTYQYEGIRQQIDHVLLSEGIAEVCLRGGIRARTVAHGDPFASDHRPFVVTLRLREP